MNKKFYMVTINEDPEFLTGKIYKTPEEAKEEAMKAIHEVNAEEDGGWIVDITGETSDDFEFPIREFYLHTMETPVIPNDMGEDVVDWIDESRWTDLNGCFDENLLSAHLGKKGIEELNKLIYDFPEKKLEDFEFGINTWTEKVEVNND